MRWTAEEIEKDKYKNTKRKVSRKEALDGKRRVEKRKDGKRVKLGKHTTQRMHRDMLKVLWKFS